MNENEMKKMKWNENRNNEMKEKMNKIEMKKVIMKIWNNINIMRNRKCEIMWNKCVLSGVNEMTWVLKNLQCEPNEWQWENSERNNMSIIYWYNAGRQRPVWKQRNDIMKKWYMWEAEYVLLYNVGYMREGNSDEREKIIVSMKWRHIRGEKHIFVMKMLYLCMGLYWLWNELMMMMQNSDSTGNYGMISSNL